MPDAPAVDDQGRRIASELATLHAIMKRLRSDTGCPWDRAQSLASLRPYLIEETYELLEAIDSGDLEHHREELGDLLFQAFFQAQIRDEEGAFDLGDAARAIATKLLRRHPHVFGDGDKKDSPEAVRVSWEQIKRDEKKGRRTLDGVPETLPSLLRAVRTGEKAASVGFDWPDAPAVREKIHEELAELDEALAAGDPTHAEAELGDLLFAVCQYARHLRLSPEDALRGCVNRFRQRFALVEDKATQRGLVLTEMNIDGLEELWQQAKRDLA